MYIAPLAITLYIYIVLTTIFTITVQDDPKKIKDYLLILILSLLAPIWLPLTLVTLYQEHKRKEILETKIQQILNRVNEEN